MRSHRSQGCSRSSLTFLIQIFRICFCLLFLCGFFLLSTPTASARSAATPWASSNETSFQSLVYGASSANDIVRSMGGVPPDEVLRGEQMFPVIENLYYYDENKTGAATIFVLENGLLVGLQLKTAGNQYVDLTYFLTSNGDRALNQSMLGGYMPYFPVFPLTAW